MSLDGQTVPVYFKSFRRMAVAFSTLFKDVWLVRTDDQGNAVKKMKVPLTYGPRMAWYDRMKARENLTDDNHTAMIGNILPRMSFKMGDPSYDHTRQRNPQNQQIKYTPSGQATSQYSPAPYNVPFELVIYAKNVDDGLMLLEQILPLFQPQVNMKILEVPELDIYNDMIILLDSVTGEDNYLEGFDDNRIVTWTLGFTVQGNVYPPFGQNTNLIYENIINITGLDDAGNIFTGDPIETVDVKANQTNPPDFDPDNSTTTVSD